MASSPIQEKQKADKILLRPAIEIKDLITHVPVIKEKLGHYTASATEQASIQIKYGTYIQKEKELVERMSQLENMPIPENFDYRKLASLGNEAREKLSKIRPATLGQASRISGINPSDVQILMVFMGR
jgi:tRNA uridine 5-carboxymethylaminomethyl modification enzyme